MDPNATIPNTTVPSTPAPNITVPMFCKYCSQPITPLDYFCPNCGKKLKDKPVSLGIWALIWLFILSAFLPPLGFGLTLRYIRSEDSTARIVGWISVIVTVVAIILAVVWTKSAMDSFSKTLNQQMQGYEF